MRKYTVIVEKEEKEFVALCPELGTVSQGETEEEALANLKEATELYLEEVRSPTPAAVIREIEIG